MARDTHNEDGGYGRGTLADGAMHYLDYLLSDECNEESAYGVTTRTAVTFTLAGGGPGADVTFIVEGDEYDGEPVEGFVSYYTMSGVAVLPLSQTDAETAWENLRRLVRDEDEED